MKAWDKDHPKAGLMARKQAAILGAAQREFLAKGFGETTMAGIAAAAGVSVATLYRHASSKDELFEAVVTGRHDPEEIAAGLAMLAKLPLREAMIIMGEGLLQSILSADAIGLHRMVIAEADRFPQLGPLVYDAVLGHATGAVKRFLTERIAAAAADELARDFVALLLGDRMVRALLGMPFAESPGERKARVTAIVDGLDLPSPTA